MEEMIGALLYRAIILSKPVVNSSNQKIRFRARFHGKTRAFMVESDDKKLLYCHRGDEVFVDAYAEETGEIIAHNRLMRWLIQLWY